MYGSLLAKQLPSPMTMDQFEVLAIEGFAFDADVKTTKKKRARKSTRTRLLKKRNISLPLDDEFGTNATTDDLMDLLDVEFVGV